jgi:hypothetical protein
MESLKEHKLTLGFVIIVIALAVFFLRGNIFTTTPKGPTPAQIALEKIKKLIITKKDCTTALPELATLIQQNPTLTEAWSWQGVCQFQTGKIADAKVTFTKVLSLDSKNVPAQNYLKIISTLPANGTVTIDGQGMTAADFQKAIGISIDSNSFLLVHVAVLPSATSTVSAAAYYKSNLAGSAAQTYFLSQFAKKGINLTATKTGNNTTLSSGTVNSSAMYSVSIQESIGTAYVTVTFTKPK